MTTSSCFLQSACVAALAGLGCMAGVPAWAQTTIELPPVRVNYLTSTKLGTTAPGAGALSRVPQPPLLAGDGNLYTLGEWGGIYSTTTSPGFYSLYADFETALRVRAFPGALVQSPLTQRMYGASIGWEVALTNSTYQQTEAVFRAEFDGTRGELLASTDGEVYHPNGVLVLDTADGQDRLYGLDMGPGGNGRLFRIDHADADDSSGSLTTVHEFGAGNGPDGRQQPNGLIRGSDGWLYGLTAYPRGVPYADGTPTNAATPTGSLYRIHPDRPDSFEVLHEFTLAEGEMAWSGMYFVSRDTTTALNGGDNQLSWLVEGPDGYLYGGLSIGTCSTQGLAHTSATTSTPTSRTSPLCGGAYTPTGTSGFANGKSMYASSYPHYDGPRVHGALYRIAKDGSGFTILHSFSGENGSQPRGSLVLAPDGAIYGTTLSGGANQDNAQQYYVGQSTTVSGYEPTYDGTLFRIVPANIRLASDGTVLASGFEHLHSFAAVVDGKRPNGLSLGNDGRLYGTTLYGGRGYTQESSGRVYLNGQNGTLFQVDLDGASLPASVTITAQPSPVTTGRTAQITWTTYGAANCKATGGASGDGWAGDQPTEGTLVVSPAAGTYYYTLTCTNTLTGGTVGNYTTLLVDVNASETDGNRVEYGNGGGALTGGALALLAGLGAAAGWRRRKAVAAGRRP